MSRGGPIPQGKHRLWRQGSSDSERPCTEILVVVLVDLEALVVRILLPASDDLNNSRTVNRQQSTVDAVNQPRQAIDESPAPVLYFLFASRLLRAPHSAAMLCDALLLQPPSSDPIFAFSLAKSCLAFQLPPESLLLARPKSQQSSSVGWPSAILPSL